MSNDKGISAFPDGDKLFEWIATVNGPADSVYDGLKYKLRLEFPAAYPYTAPTVKFVTPCFHPNVDQHGNICLDILKEKWSALYEVRTILLSIQSLLGMNKILTYPLVIPRQLNDNHLQGLGSFYILKVETTCVKIL